MKKVMFWVSLYGSLKKLRLAMKHCLLLLFISTLALTANAAGAQGNEAAGEISQQAQKQLTGVVTDVQGEPIPGVTIIVKGMTIGTVTDFDGVFTLNVPSESQALVFSFVGYAAKEVAIGQQTKFNVVLEEETVGVEEVVIVGYGVQKKESVVGAITHTTGEDLQKAGGVTNVGEALQGRLPGVTTMTSSSRPGEDDVQIFIRGQSSWNNGGQPLVLIDGTERSMSDIDINEIDQISVLKDASATAVFGVKGGNGVILITTKRGQTGKAQLSLSANTTIKMISKLPEKLDSYDAIFKSHESIMRELMYAGDDSWGDVRPMEIVDKYRNPLTEEEMYQYPNVDWKDVLIKDFAQDFRINLGVRGGTEFAKYFGSLSYQGVSDIVNGEKYDSGKGYLGEYKYDRFNYRSNVDFKITNSTKFSVNLAGYLGIQEEPVDNINTIVNGLYLMAPNLYTPVYPDGYYGMYYQEVFAIVNPVVNLTNTGYKTNTNFRINSDFILEQDLDFITKGLSVKGKYSFDNSMTSVQALTDPSGNYYHRIYYPDGSSVDLPEVGVNGYDFALKPWSLDASAVKDNTRLRRVNYEVALNYSNVFAEKHNVSLLGLWKREEYAKGSEFPHYSEDWVSRVTYNYDTRYFLDVSGAYNGSEQFGRGYRFDLFPSAALGWMVSNESFMDRFSWLDKLKIRGSYGLIGDDRINSARWSYLAQWASGGKAYLDPSIYDSNSNVPYVFYRESTIGNADLHWEKSIKSNIGAEVALWKNAITADFDYFYEDRKDILLLGSQRSIPDFYGAAPADFNSGEVEVKGYELVLGANHKFHNGISTWAKYSLTNAKDKILYKEDPLYRPFYQKAAGYPIGQLRAGIPADIMQNWDDIYMSTPLVSGQEFLRVGYYDAVDFDGDGKYDSAYDNVPFGYPTRPQKTWNFSFGASYKAVSVMVEFYGTQNSMRQYKAQTFSNQTDLFFTSDLDYWSKENPNATRTMPTWNVASASFDPYRNFFDGSFTRLKTIEFAYQVPKSLCEKLGVSSLKLYANGNNLYLWSKMPDDREYNSSGTADSEFRGDYPSLKRFNFGLDLNF